MKSHDETRQFPSGAIRDGGKKPLMHLISPHLMNRLGEWMRVACEDREPPYPERNWEQGFSFSTVVSSLQRHIEAFKLGDASEDHLAAGVFNLMALIHFEEEIKAGKMSAALDDMPHYATPKLGDERYVNGQKERYVEFGSTATEVQARRAQLVEEYATLKPGEALGIHPDDREWLRSQEPPSKAIAFASEAIPTMLDEENRAMAGLPPLPQEKKPFSNIVSDCTITHGPEGGVYMKKKDKPFTVYLCGPISGRPIDHNWRESMRTTLWVYGIKTLDPLRGKKSDLISDKGMGYNGELADPTIADRDVGDIQEADLIYVHFPYSPDRQSIGSLMEMGMAHALGKPVVLFADIDEFQKHLFCRRFCIHASSQMNAIEIIRDYANNKR